MTIQDFRFNNEIHIDNVYIVVDKKERQNYSVQGGGFSYNGTGGNHISGKTDYEYILIIKSVWTDEVQEKKVTVDTFYKSKINEIVVFDDGGYTIRSLKPALKSTDTAKMLLTALDLKQKEVNEKIDYQNQKIEKLSKHKILNGNKIEETRLFLTFLNDALKEIKNAIAILDQHINSQSLGSSWGQV